MLNRVVLNYNGKSIRKGTTDNFFPNKDVFHVKEHGTGAVFEVNFASLKAVYFVKTFEGNPDYNERSDAERTGFGKKIRILFKDGETQIGYTQGFSPNRPGFFVFPVDESSNNERIFVITAATKEVQFI